MPWPFWNLTGCRLWTTCGDGRPRLERRASLASGRAGRYNVMPEVPMRKRHMMCVALAAAWLFALNQARAIDTANPDASPDAKKILNYLPTLPGHYDRRVISGQQFGPGENAGGLFAEQVKTLHNAAGKWVAMVGADYGSPKSNAEPGAGLSALNQVLVDYWKAGGLVTISFHAR